MNKDMLYYNLIDEMKKDTCVICNIVRKRMLQMMDTFLYEGVNDVSIREKICDSRGFCSLHNKMLIQQGNPLAHAIIYKELISQAKEDIEERNFSKYKERTKCIFCIEQEKIETDYVQAFTRGFGEKEFQKAFAERGLLCMYHLSAIDEKSPDCYRLIKSICMDKYDVLLQELSQIMKKNDYRFVNENWNADARDAWRKAAAIISNACGKQ